MSRSRANRSKSLRRFLRRILADFRAGRPAADCMAEIDERFQQEGDAE